MSEQQQGWSVEESASVLGVSESVVYSAIRRGDLRARSTSRPIRLDPSEVDRFQLRKIQDAPTIPALTVRAAANRLGLSVWAIHKAIDRGELHVVVRDPIKLSADDVEALRRRKQNAAIARIGEDRLVKTARDTRAFLHPPVTAGGARGHAALETVNDVVKSAFGPALLAAAAMPDGSCRWCAAVMAGRLLHVPVREEQLAGEVGLALLGGPDPECVKHRALLRGRMDRLAARVHRSGTGPAKAAGSTVPAVPAVPRRTPARRVQDGDGGRALIAARLRAERERLKAAKRSGDQRRAIQLRQTIQGLEQDAAAVDGRSAVVASARPGKLACGHLLAAGCACPRRASTRGRR